MYINGKNMQAKPEPKPIPKEKFRCSELTVQIITLVLVLLPVVWCIIQFFI